MKFESDGFRLSAYDGDQRQGYLILDTSDDQRPSVSFIYVEPKFRRSGVGLALCLEAARRLGKIGMKLYSADFQHLNVENGCEMVKKLFPEIVGYEGERMYLSFVKSRNPSRTK
jgi:ribosomal protein S18 acetylase RimI-like enzyme